MNTPNTPTNTSTLNYPRNFGVKAGLTQDLAEFSGSPGQFRDFFAYKENKDGKHLLYTPLDIRRLRLNELGHYSKGDNNPTNDLPPVIITHTSQGRKVKTMLSSNLAVSFALLGHKTLLIDADPEGSASKALGVNPSTEEINHIGELLKRQAEEEEVNIQKAIKSIYPERMLDLIPADIDLAHSLYWVEEKASLANNAFERFMNIHADTFSKYEVIIIDTESSASKLNKILLNTATSEIITPLELEGQSFKSLEVLEGLITDVNEQKKERAEQAIKPLIVINAYKHSDKSKLQLRTLTEELGEYLYPYPIPASSKLSRQSNLAEATQKESYLPEIERFPTSRSTKAILSLAKHLTGRFKLKINGVPNSYSLNI